MEERFGWKRNIKTKEETEKMREKKMVCQTIRVLPERLNELHFYAKRAGLSYLSVSDFFRVILEDWLRLQKLSASATTSTPPDSNAAPQQTDLLKAIEDAKQKVAEAKLTIFSTKDLKDSWPDDFKIE
jgi:hypothetical protein